MLVWVMHINHKYMFNATWLLICPDQQFNVFVLEGYFHVNDKKC